MELDELKKSWNALNARLPKEPIADERQIAELVSRCKGNTQKSLRSLIGFQRFSLCIGILAWMICLAIGWYIHSCVGDKELQTRAYVLLVFFGATLTGGTWWDYKTYRWAKDTRVDVMTVAEVSRRMVALRRWTRYEVLAISLWTLCFDLLYCWAIGIFQQGGAAGVSIMMAFLLIIEAPLIFLLYKKAVYKHLDNIKTNMEELNDVCTE